MFLSNFRISGGELFERVIDDDFILTERLCELYMMQICEGVSFMHTSNIIHLDMKVRPRRSHRKEISSFSLFASSRRISSVLTEMDIESKLSILA
jgi:serine/threonine protein kinase